MSGSIYKAGMWLPFANARKRYSGGAWTEIASPQRWDGAQWLPLWRPAGTYSAEFSLTSYGSYKRATAVGSRYYELPDGTIAQGQCPTDNMCGMGSLMFFDNTAIIAALYDTNIISVELYMRCTYSQAGAGTNVRTEIHYGTNLTSLPDSWYGTDSGDAAPSIVTLTQGVGTWVTLNNSIASGMRSGKIKYLSLNCALRTEERYTGQFDANAVKLRVTYSIS